MSGALSLSLGPGEYDPLEWRLVSVLGSGQARCHTSRQLSVVMLLLLSESFDFSIVGLPVLKCGGI